MYRAPSGPTAAVVTSLNQASVAGPPSPWYPVFPAPGEGGDDAVGVDHTDAVANEVEVPLRIDPHPLPSDSGLDGRAAVAGEGGLPGPLAW